MEYKFDDFNYLVRALDDPQNIETIMNHLAFIKSVNEAGEGQYSDPSVIKILADAGFYRLQKAVNGYIEKERKNDQANVSGPTFGADAGFNYSTGSNDFTMDLPSDHVK